MPFEEPAKQNFDHCDSMDTPYWQSMPGAFDKAKRSSGQPTISRIFGAWTRPCGLAPRSAIIIEGILIFENQALRDLMDIKIFVDTDPDSRLSRRLVRDIRERGRTMDMVVDQYMTTVRPLHMEFVEPSKRHAGVIIPEGGHNEVSIDPVTQKIWSLVPR